MELMQTPIYRALYRPNLLLGGERELVLIGALLSAGTAMVGLTIPAFIAGAIIWLVCMAATPLLARADPNMAKVYLRYLKYQHHYLARSTPWQQSGS